MVAILKNATWTIFSIVTSCSLHQFTQYGAQDINFHWNLTKLKFLRYDGHFEKKGGSEQHFDSTIMYATSNYPQDINFYWNRTKLKFVLYGGHFGSIVMLATPNATYSSLNYLSSYYTFSDIKCKSRKFQKNDIRRAITPISFHENCTAYRSRAEQPKISRNFDICLSYQMSKLKNSKKRPKKSNNSYIGSRIVTKIAQQINLVVLNDLRFHGILISACVFELFAKNCCFIPMIFF